LNAQNLVQMVNSRRAPTAIEAGKNLPAVASKCLHPGEYVDRHGEIRSIFPSPAQPVPRAQEKPHIADLIGARASPKTPKPDASADAPGLDVQTAVQARTPIHHDKETDES
jgi:hypothetical protein